MCALAGVGLIVGLVAPPAAVVTEHHVLNSWGRLMVTAATALAVLIGPGLTIRRLWPARLSSLGLVWLPGFLVLIVTGLAAWMRPAHLAPQITAAALFTPAILIPLTVALLRGLRTSAREQAAILLLGILLAMAIGKDAYSLGPVGELNAGLTARSLEVGDRDDNRVQYHVVQVVANGVSPFSPLAKEAWAPNLFSARGPLAGLASSGVVLSAGARPPIPDDRAPWAPFDAQGYAAYRVAMAALALTIVLATYGLVRLLAGEGAALYAVGLSALTPMLIHETFFTWPKLLSGALLLVSGIGILQRRRLRAGGAASLAYLAHPVALLSVPTLLLLEIAINRIRGRRWAAAVAGTSLVLIGPLLGVALWHLYVGGGAQIDFLRYPGLVDLHPPAGIGAWVAGRWASIANTLVPLHLFLFYRDHQWVNASRDVMPGPTPTVVQFFFLYWNTVPFAVGIVFFPLLVAGVIRFGIQRPRPFAIAVVAPFLVMSLYWGGAITGMVREGLQSWVVTLLIIFTLAVFWGAGPSWLRGNLVRVCASARVVEVWLVLLLPTLATRRRLLDPRFADSDAIALAVMTVGSIVLAVVSWRCLLVTKADIDAAQGTIGGTAAAR